MPTTDLTPPRLAVGSHSDTRDYGCAMNVISWENGDTSISDLPDCTAQPLARMIHHVNDTYCKHIEYSPKHGVYGGTVALLCAPCSVEVLDVAHRTVGTTGTPAQTRRWGWLWAEQLLVGDHGVIHDVQSVEGRLYVHEAAATVRRYIDGETGPIYAKKGFHPCNSVTVPALEAEALRLAGMCYQRLTDAEDGSPAQYVNPSLGVMYLAVRHEALVQKSYPHYPTRPSLLIDEARIAIDAWRAVMETEVDASESAEVVVSTPELLSA